MALENVLSAVNTANQYIVSANSKLGIAGFRFMAVTDYNLSGQSELTDHRIETGGIVHDYITNRPLELEITGVISELFYENDLNKDTLREQVAETARYAFNISNTLAIATDAVQSITQLSGDSTIQDVETTALDLWKDVDNVLIEDSTVKKAFRFFSALRDARETVTVSSPFGVFNDMVIIGLEMSASNGSFGSSGLTIRLKKAFFIKPLVSTNQPITINQAKKDIEKEIKSLQTDVSEVYNGVSDFIGGII